MHIAFDTNELTDVDRAALRALLGDAPAAALAPAAPAADKPAPKPAPEPKPAPAPEPTPEEDESADEPEADEAPVESATDDAPTLEDAVQRATELVSTGKAGDVKAALSTVGAKRVSELKGDAITAFISALSD